MLVSIITPSFNHGRFIEKTIRSVLEQDYPHIEYIVMDGGSTDGTIDILKRYGDRIKWRTEPDAGQSDAINKGFCMAKGEIVAWLNSDDYYQPGAIRKVVEIFINRPSAAMVYGDGYWVDEAGKWEMPYGDEPFFDLWKMIHLYNFIFQSSAFIRRDALFSAGLLDQQYSYTMDWDLWIRLSKAGRIIHIPEKLSCARVYPGTKTQSGGWRRWREIKNISRRYGDYRWPPAIFLHVPKGFLKNHRGNYTAPVKGAVSTGKRLLYPVTMGGASGFYQDGYMSRRGFISLPLIKEAKSLVLHIEPVISGKVWLKINKRGKEMFSKNEHTQVFEITLEDDLKEREFLHLEFRSASSKKLPATSLYPYPRRVSFCVKDLYYLTADGRIIKDLGFPNLIR